MEWRSATKPGRRRLTMVASAFGAFLFVPVAMLLVAIVLGILVTLVALVVRYVRSSNHQLKTVTSASAQRERILREAAVRCADEELRCGIVAVADEARFSDWAIVLPTDGELDARILALFSAVNAGDNESARGCFREIEVLIEGRKAAVAEARRGSF